MMFIHKNIRFWIYDGVTWGYQDNLSNISQWGKRRGHNIYTRSLFTDIVIWIISCDTENKTGEYVGEYRPKDLQEMIFVREGGEGDIYKAKYIYIWVNVQWAPFLPQISTRIEK